MNTKSFSMKQCGKILIASLTPVLLFTGLRLFIRDILGVHLGYSFGTDYDFAPQSLIAFALLLFALAGQREIHWGFQKKIFTACVIAVITFCALSFLFKESISYQNTGLFTAWFCLAVFCIGSSAFLFVSPAFFLNKINLPLYFATFLIAGTNLFSKTILGFLWEPVTHWSGIIAYGVLKVFFPAIQYGLHYPATGMREEYTLLTQSNFAISIGKGCGGMEGICFFVMLIGFLMIKNFKIYKKQEWLVLSLGGVFFMYVMNLLRICLFFTFALFVQKSFGLNTAVSAVQTLFHNGLGWVIYSVGLYGYFSLSRKFFGEKKVQEPLGSLPSLQAAVEIV